MYPVTQDFLEAMKADKRQVLAKVEVDYTDPFLDQSIEVAVSERANVSYPAQTADAVEQVPYKWASLDGSWVLDGSFRLAPTSDKLAQYQFGWWGSQLAGTDGAFASPYPALTVTHLPRPVHTLRVVGDSARGEYPVDFTIELYAADNTLLYTETVTGNTQVAWSKALATPVLDVAKQMLTITRWSHEGRQAKIAEFFTSIQETYLSGDLVSLRLLEERETSQGSLPVGNITANEVAIRLSNDSKKFDPDNAQSPLYRLLKPNRRVRPWLGICGEGSGVNVQQSVDFNQGTLNNLIVQSGKLCLPSVGAPTFTRNSVAYKFDGTQVPANVPRFETVAGLTGVMVEGGTTNYIPDTDRDGNPDNWECTWNRRGVAPAVKEFITISGIPGKVLHIKDTSAGTQTGGCQTWEGYTSLNQNLSGKTFTLSFWSKGVYTGCNGGQLYVNYYDSSGTFIYRDSITWSVTPDWQRIIRTVTAPTGAYKVYICIYLAESLDTGDSYDVYCGGLQFEEKVYATSWAGMGATRSPEVLPIPTAGWNKGNWTKEFTFIPTSTQAVSGKTGCLWDLYIDADNYYCIKVGPNGKPYLEVKSNGTAYQTATGSAPALAVNSKYVFAAKGDGTNMALFANGTKVSEVSYAEPVGTLPAYQYLGCDHNGANHANGVFYDHRDSNIARTDEEIQEAYQSGQLPVDEWTTYYLPCNGNLNHGQGGSYVSPEFDLSAVGRVATSAVNWEADNDGITRVVKAKLDNQADWTLLQNGGRLPVNYGDLLTGRKVQFKVEMLRDVA